VSRRTVLSLLVPGILLAGFGASASGATANGDRSLDVKTTDVCVVVWNGPQVPGRDGYCVKLPNLP
jgi:hypothetical protein